MADKKSYLDQLESGSMNEEQAVKDAENAYNQGLHQRDLEVRNWELQEELFEVTKKGLELVVPTHKYHEDPRFWEIQRGLSDISKEQQRLQHMQRMGQIEKMLEARKDSLRSKKGDEK